jgi:flagellin
MSQVINTNTMSLMAQNNLNKSQSSLGTAIERLSSGLRINSAKDDAAGQAISNRFTASINGLTQASRNANDGISLAQTTEGALNEINDNLQNIRRLTVQAANGTNSDSDRASIQSEIDQRLNEISRVSEQTEFNGVKVLSQDQTMTIQVGANDNETITIDLKQMNKDTLGMSGFDVKSYGTPGDTISTPAAGNTVTVGGAQGADYKLESDDIDAIKTALNTDDVKMISDKDGNVTFYGKDKTSGEWQSVTATNTTANGFEVGTAAAADQDTIDKLEGKDGLLATVDSALEMVDSLRSELGAAQNRFSSVISNLDSAVNNLSESRSRILDADFASEVSNMSRANILQSAGTTVLAQANQVPQNVLSLLR